MALEDEISFMLEVKADTKFEIIKEAVAKLGFTLDDNYKVEVPTPRDVGKTILYLIGGPKNNSDKVDTELRKLDWVYGVFSNPKMDYFKDQDWRCC
ncbi:hypothetical protein HY837_06465 [archaeon]|nr:hypothetical protein [archaeon]